MFEIVGFVAKNLMRRIQHNYSVVNIKFLKARAPRPFNQAKVKAVAFPEKNFHGVSYYERFYELVIISYD
jgi:hypothetical protein